MKKLFVPGLLLCIFLNVSAQQRDQNLQFHRALLTKKSFGLQSGRYEPRFFERTFHLAPEFQRGERLQDSTRSAAKKPPLRANRIVGELLICGVFGIFGVMGGAVAGASIERIREGPCYGEFCFLGGAIVGGIVGYTIGSAIGVKIIGSDLRETGSFIAALSGSAFGLFLWYTLAQEAEGIYATFWFWPPVGATIFFNATRRYRKSAAKSQALLDFDKAGLHLNFPALAVSRSQYNSKKIAGSLALLSASF